LREVLAEARQSRLAADQIRNLVDEELTTVEQKEV